MKTARLLFNGRRSAIAPLWVVPLLAACGASTPSVEAPTAKTSEAAPCGTPHPATCENALQCVLGRCRKRGTLPMSSRSLRLPMTPSKIGWFRMDHVPDDPIATRLGQSGRVETIGLNFDWQDLAPRKVERALLVLTPSDRCETAAGGIRIDIQRIAHHWTKKSGRPPRLLPVTRSARKLLLGERPLRMDVTEWVREARQQPQRFSGLALSLSSELPEGVCLDLSRSANGPTLEVFFKPAPSDLELTADQKKEKKKKRKKKEAAKRKGGTPDKDLNPTFHEVDDD